jgi:steroid 5-alpha reductase family enzyme
MLIALIIWLVLALSWRFAMPADARGRRWNIVHMLLPGVVIALWGLAPSDLDPPLASFLVGGGAMIVFGAAGWAIGEARRNHSIMDIVYPMISFGTAAVIIVRSAPEPTMRVLVLMALMLLWMLRLARHATGTNLKVEQDPYASLRRRFGARWPLWSFFSVYMLQGTILWIWCLPFAFAGQSAARALQPLDWVGIAVWLAGVAFQAIGDHQMKAFKADPANRGGIMDRGLWAHTRHPNYFGEALMWWGYFFFALVHPWGWLAAIGPAYVTWFMGWGSATPGNERHMRKSRGAAFDDYARRVPMFFPRPWPRR